jgi:hypothetical protein
MVLSLTRTYVGADDGIRTRDPHLGKVMLYQLSHVRVPVLPYRAVDSTSGTRPGESAQSR